MPSRRELESNALLESFATGYKPPTFYADQLAPIVPVDESAGRYRQASLYDAISAAEDDTIAEYEEATEIDYKYTEKSYICIDRAFQKPTKWDVAKKNPEASRKRTTERILNKLLRKREKRVFDLAQDAANYATTIAAGNPWTDLTDGDPLGDIDSMISALTLRHANEDTAVKLLINKEAFLAMRKHPALRGQGSESPIVARAAIAALLDIDEILVTQATINTAPADKDRTTTPARIWAADNACLFLTPKTDPDDEEGLFMATMRYNGISGSGTGMLVQHWDDISKGIPGTEYTRASFSDAEVLPQSDAAILLTGIMS